MVSTVTSTALVPLRGGQADSVTDTPSRRASRPGFSTFASDEALPDRQGPATGNVVGGRTPVADSLPLRRRTDRGETADQEIRIPPHLERRRAWRETFGLNTWHAQQLAQDDGEDEEKSPLDTRIAAARAYRSVSGRGRLDLDLAQLVSVTV